MPAGLARGVYDPETGLKRHNPGSAVLHDREEFFPGEGNACYNAPNSSRSRNSCRRDTLSGYKSASWAPGKAPALRHCGKTAQTRDLQALQVPHAPLFAPFRGRHLFEGYGSKNAASRLADRLSRGFGRGLYGHTIDMGQPLRGTRRLGNLPDRQLHDAYAAGEDGARGTRPGATRRNGQDYLKLGG